jgi:hypothetical protein
MQLTALYATSDNKTLNETSMVSARNRTNNKKIFAKQISRNSIEIYGIVVFCQGFSQGTKKKTIRRSNIEGNAAALGVTLLT